MNMIMCNKCRTNTEKGKPHKCVSNRVVPLFDREKEHRKIYYTAKWKKLRRYVIEAYGEHGCSRCGSFENLEVHHICKLESNIEKAFDIDNCAILCRSCHKYIDRNLTSGELDYKFERYEYNYNVYY